MDQATYQSTSFGTAERNNPWRVSLAASLGSFIEYYDFAVYAVMALTMAPLFFAVQSQTTAVLSALLVYALAFVVRPIGAVTFGWLGDRYGRRNALIITIIGMGIGSTGIGLLPTYSQIGVLAPALLVTLRIVQGFFAGGEVSGAATYVSECAPQGRKGFFGSINVTGVMAGGAAASVTGAIVRTMIPHDALLSWGWRVPFFVSVPLLLVGLFARLKLEDSNEFEVAAQRHELVKAPVLEVFRHHFRALLQTFGLAFGMTVTGLFSSAYLFIYIVNVAKLPIGWASWTFAIVECVAVSMTPFVGLIADRTGPKPPVVVGLLGYIVLTPLAMIVMATHDLNASAFMLLLLAVPHALVQGAVYPIYPELFPTHVRYSGMALGFNVAIVVGGGIAPWVSSTLAETFQTPVAGSGYVVLGGIVAMIALFTVRRGDPRRAVPTLNPARSV